MLQILTIIIIETKINCFLFLRISYLRIHMNARNNTINKKKKTKLRTFIIKIKSTKNNNTYKKKIKVINF